ncbi:hypothetical protein ES702_00695 [subsurface metagenome]
MNIDIVKVVIDVLMVFPLIMAIVLYLDYNTDGKYDVEFKIRDVTFRNEALYRKLWEFVTGEKLEVKENEC